MPGRRLVPALRTALIGVVSLTSIASGAQLSVAARPLARPRPPAVKVAKEPSVPVSVVKPTAGAPDRDADSMVTTGLAATWPTPGEATVNLAGAATGRTAANGGAVEAGELPIRIGPAARPAAGSAKVAAPGQVKVELIGRSGSQLRVRLSRTDGLKSAGPVSLQVDYTSFAHAYGGDWADRLQIVRLPDCALSTPELTACKAVPVRTDNTGAGQLSADVTAASAPTTYAVQAAAAGSAGDSTATSLNPTATWQVGGSSGDFNWTYPMQVPPSLGGPKADISLGYSSGSVDGRTSSANSQSSWAGAGFELAPGGSIERRYAACAAKSEQTGNNGKTPVGDLCWATDNATFTLNGAGGELVKDDATGVWHPRNDDGTKVEHLYGKDNGDGGPEGTGTGARGEYWVITDKSGTKFYFGLNKIPGNAGATQDTKSVWTVPVFGNHGKDATHPADEPCHATAFANSSCDQAYRWNLDYVVDPHGNTMTLWYDVETNKYARNATATSVSTYTRSGNIRRIEYGQADQHVFDQPAVAAIDFTTANRCRASCTPADYVDTPLDQECTSTTNCNNHFYPTFWTKKRLAKITTSVWRGTAFSQVNSWSFRHAFLDPQDNSRSPILWLDGITNTGLVGGTLATPEMTFASKFMANRVVGPGDGLPSFRWPRIASITYGSGGQLVVGYSDPQCSLPGNVPTPDNNTMLCHPIKWTPQNQAERQDWFHKYVVKTVSEADLTTGVVPVKTTVEYEGTPAWRHDDEDGLVEVGQKTWSQWRGYPKVKVTKGDGTVPPQVTENVYFRGMDGDPNADGTTKSVAVTDSTGATMTDRNAYAGALREQATYDGATIVDRSITDPWISPVATATRVSSWGTTKSYKVEEKAVRQDQKVAGGTRRSASENHYTDDGVLDWTNDAHNVDDPNDDTCTRYEYTGNAARGIVELPTRKQTVSVGCAATYTKAQVIGDQKTVYDQGATPTKGEVSSLQRLSGFDDAGHEIYQTISTSEYDSVGRVAKTTNAENLATTVSYLPATGPVTETTVTQPNGQSSKTLMEPAWGVEKSVIDPAGRQTDTSRDPLGRVLKTFLPGQDRSKPNSANTYAMDPLKPGVVTTNTINDDGTTSISIQLTDGLMRKRQTQTAAPGGGRIVTDYRYDSRGLLVAELGQYYNDAPPGTEVVVPDNDAMVPAKKTTDYDDQGRPTVERFSSMGQELWHTSHATAADRETITPPTGEQPTTKITDVQGRPIEVRQYAGDPATSTYDKTTYTYKPAGQLATVTDPAGNVWSYDYDVRGRKIKSTDPDRGDTTYTYNDLDQLTSTKDASGNVLSYTYDSVGRKTAMYQGAVTGGTLLAEWKYDTLRAGSLTSSTRYVDGKPYTVRFTGYDDAGRATGSEVVVPEGEALAGTYPLSTSYTSDGQVKTVTLPGVGGLPEETLTTTYGDDNLPVSMGVDGGQMYVLDATYTPYKETSSLSMARGDQWVQQSFEYEPGSRRLARTGVLTGNEQVDDTKYSYDQAGNVTKIADTPGPSTGEQTDNQCFEYDAYRRLTAAWTPGDGNCSAAPSATALGGPAPYWHSWTFDVTGNRKSEKRTTATSTTTSTYNYLAGKPHALDNVVTTSGGTTKTDSYTYNERGDLKTRTLAGVAETTTFDTEGHLAEVNGAGKTSFVYDADGNRLLRKDPKGTTLYLGGTELLLKAGATTPVGTRYYTFGDATVAIRTGEAISWIAGDLHGTATLSIDADTGAVQRRRNTPYGEARGAVPTMWPGNRGFVGGPNDESTGLVHLGAREYDPTRGRFISVDPVVDFADPQQLNAYSYANNNPISFSDADGRRYVTDIVQESKVVLKTITERIVTYQKVLIQLTVWKQVISTVATVLAAFGMRALADALWRQVTVIQEVTKRIVQIRTRLIREVVRITRRIKRYVGPDEARSLTELARSATALADSSKGADGLWKMIGALSAFQNSSNKWAAAAKLVDRKQAGGGGGGGGAAAGGGNPFGNNDPNDEIWDKTWIVVGWGAAGAAGIAACTITFCEIAVGAAAVVGGVAMWNCVNGPKGTSWGDCAHQVFVENRQQVQPPPVIGPGPRGWGERQEVVPPPVIGHP